MTLIPDDRDSRVRARAKQALSDLEHSRRQEGVGRKVRNEPPIPGAKEIGILFRRFVPSGVRRTVRRYAKMVVGAAGTVATVVNAYAPAWSPQVQAVLAVILGIGTILGIRQVRNAR